MRKSVNSSLYADAKSIKNVNENKYLDYEIYC